MLQDYHKKRSPSPSPKPKGRPVLQDKDCAQKLSTFYMQAENNETTACLKILNQFSPLNFSAMTGAAAKMSFLNCSHCLRCAHAAQPL